MSLSFRSLFLNFVAVRRKTLAVFQQDGGGRPRLPREKDLTAEGARACCPDALMEAVQRLLQWPGASKHATILTQALLDPYFPAEMIRKTLFAHVTGMRFYIDKERPEMQPVLLRDLTQFAKAFLHIREDLANLASLRPSAPPLDGRRLVPPSGQWCRMCGTCCAIGGVPAVPPQGVVYPSHWRGFLEGTQLDNQQLCPFLFQSPGSMHHFCSIHPIKPVPCRAFDAEDCRARRQDVPLHQGTFEPEPWV